MAKKIRTNNVPPVDQGDTTQGTAAVVHDTEIISAPEEKTVDPLDIISRAPLENLQDLDAFEQSLNPVVTDNGFGNGVVARDEDNLLGNIQSPKSPSLIQDDVVVAAPYVRKVVIKKINRFAFRLGLEKLKEAPRLMPGVGHTWSPAKKGTDFLTGLEDDPKTRVRLERALRVDLSPTSQYWSTLTFRLEDKEHGQILNFDDKVMGPYYEVIYYSMLASDIIANGLQEYSNGSKPDAEWFIENKEAEAESKKVNMTFEQDARRMFESFSEQKCADVAKLCGLPVWGMSPGAARMDLWEWLKSNVDNAKTFLEKTKLQDGQFAVAVLVKNAIKLNVIRRNKTNEYVFANEVLGPTEEHLVVRLSQAPNATLRNSIQMAVDAKLRG